MPASGPCRDTSRTNSAALTKIFLDEIEQHLLAASGGAPDAETPRASRPRLGGLSFLHRFGSALNHHVHLHACVTDGVFVPAAGQAGCDASPTFLPARPVTAADLAALTERVRRRVIRWFRLTRLLDAAAAADMIAWENSGFSVDASVRITLLDRDVRIDELPLIDIRGPLKGSHATVRTAREKSVFKTGLRQREKPGLERG